MKPGETAIRSPLDKPLGELTEEDISQLTREDCRRYLKEKGMRRPSWNKSQAIQQVISLKTLLETRADSADASDAIRLKVASVAPEPENLTQMESASPDESTSDRTKDPLPSSVAVDASCQIPATANGPFRLETSISPSCGGDRAASGGPVGQMTIFYDGKVNVYEGVPAEKARIIMQMAGSPNCAPFNTAATASPAGRPFPCRTPTEPARMGPPSPPLSAISPTTQATGKITQYTRESTEEGKISRETEGPTSRKASLKRYLEKRKDRGRFNKKKIGGSSSCSLEMYINQQVRSHASNGHTRSGTCSPTQPKPPHTPTRCSSVENQPKILLLSVDLNDDGPEDGDQD